MSESLQSRHVEKVARAIAEPIMRKFDGWHPAEPVLWERLPGGERDQDNLREIAQAAIAAHHDDLTERLDAMVRVNAQLEMEVQALERELDREIRIRLRDCCDDVIQLAIAQVRERVAKAANPPVEAGERLQ